MDDFNPIDDKAVELRENMEKFFVKIVQDFGDTVKKASMEEKARWYTLTRNDVCKRFKFLIEKQPWNDFLKEIDSKYNINSYDLLCIK